MDPASRIDVLGQDNTVEGSGNFRSFLLNFKLLQRRLSGLFLYLGIFIFEQGVIPLPLRYTGFAVESFQSFIIFLDIGNAQLNLFELGLLKNNFLIENLGIENYQRVPFLDHIPLIHFNTFNESGQLR